MFVLLVSVVLVYAVFFNIRGESLYVEATSALQAIRTGESPEKDNKNTAQLTGMESSGASASDSTTGVTMVFSGLDQLFGDEKDYLGTGVVLLSGTSLFEGNIDVLSTLGINYEYVLKDGQYNIYYVYIGANKTYNLPAIAREFG